MQKQGARSMVRTNAAVANMWRLLVQMIVPLPGDTGALEAP